MSINKVILIGNLGQEPEIRQTQEGKEIATLSLATSESWKDKHTGEKKEQTEWHRIVVFSQGLVGIVKNYMKKGDKIFVEGQVKTRKWVDSNNIERYTTEIVLQGFHASLQILTRKEGSKEDNYNRDDSNNKFNARKFTQDAVNRHEGNIEIEEIDDEIPF